MSNSDLMREHTISMREKHALLIHELLLLKMSDLQNRMATCVEKDEWECARTLAGELKGYGEVFAVFNAIKRNSDVKTFHVVSIASNKV